MIDRKLLVNPFRSDVVSSPEQPLTVDVSEIHQQPFGLSRRIYEGVAGEHISSSVLLHGEAGCGKTHLLSRLRRWLAGEMDIKPSLAPAVFIGIRMETAPSQIWRHVRRRFAEDLTKKAQDGSCPLDGILGRFAAQYSGKLQDAFDGSDIRDLGLDLTKVLEHFQAGRHRRLCRAWLAGEGLSDSDLQLLNLPAAPLEEIEEDFAESNARRVVLAIVRLCAPSPVVFCFDQLEALGISQQGNRSFAPFSRMGAALIDETNNVLMISTILATFLQDAQNGSNASDYQRISKNVMPLHPLDRRLGRALIDSRLALIPELNGEDPIPEASLRAFYEQQHGSCNARRLIHEARRLFAEWQECATQPPVPTFDFLDREFESLWARSEARNGPGNADAILAHGLPVALQTLGRKAETTGSGVTIGDGPSRIEAVFVNHSNMTSLAATLKRLIDRKTEDAPLCLIRDRRLPVPVTAKATQERLRQIEERGGRLVRVEAEALAALDAMRQLLTAATSGDLSSNGETIEAKTVREWLSRNLPQEVQALAVQLLNEETPTHQDLSPDVLLELISRRKVVSLDEVVRATSWPREEIEDYARTHPLHVRWFGGSCPVVCQAVVAGSQKEIPHGE